MNINNNIGSLRATFGKNPYKHVLARLKTLESDTAFFSNSKKLTVEERLSKAIESIASEQHGREETFRTSLNEVVHKNTEDNPKLLEMRTSFLENFGKKYAQYLRTVVRMNCLKLGQPDLIFDNIPQIDQLFADEDNATEFVQKDFFENFNEKSLATMYKVQNDKSLSNLQKVALILYSSNEHNVEMGSEEVSVDSSELIALLTGYNSISTMENNNYDTFNSTIENLTEKSHRNTNGAYYKIAEGILTQRPDLAVICNMYEAYNRTINDKVTSKDEFCQYIKDFFNILEKTGKLERNIKLKTIVPDENAISVPSLTKTVFELKNSKSIL